MRRWTEAWNDFWFKPVPATSIGLYRICFGLIVLHNNWLLAPELLQWFGSRGAFSFESWRNSPLYDKPNLFHVLPRTDDWLIVFFILFTMAAFTLTIGLWTRASAVVVWLGLISLTDRNPYILSHADILMRLNAFWLIFSSAGKALSVDRLRLVLQGKSPPAAHSPLGQRLLQCQSALMYFSASSWKMLSGPSWWDGTAIYYSARWYIYQRLPVPYLFDHAWTCRLLGWGTLAAETALWTVVWVPKLRYAALAAGALLHLGIEWSLNIPLFSPLAIVGYLNFVPPEDLARIGKKIKTAWRR